MNKNIIYRIGLLLALSIVFFSKPASANYSAVIVPDTNGIRSDTINVLSYTINLNITDFTTDTLRGSTIVRFAPKMNNINTLSLDLLHMTVDSIDMSNKQVPFTYNDTLIIIELPATENIGDTADVTVYYHGKPIKDTSGVGGFYFQNPFACFIGEAASKVNLPQCFGRCCYPCFDNFRERALYTFNITTDSNKIAYCNGYLAKDTTIGSFRTRTWIMNNTIPTYLASIDVAPYIQVNDTFKGTDTIPIVIAAIKADSSKISGAFATLKNAISIYQNCFGPYAWNKVGFSEVGPTNASIEDASNIAYPNYAFNPAFEYLMAHEFGHHWFGDEVTCRTASEMWLNEGFATYCTYIYAEYLYGFTSYRSMARTNHLNVLKNANLSDTGFRALSPMAPAYTFGMTTYQKGADVVGTLRGYVGDSNFFNGLKYYLSSHKYQPVTTDTLKNSLERYSGMNLDDFFNDWVYAPGFAQFSIDSIVSVPLGPDYNVTVYVKQRLDHAPAYYNNVPLPVTFKSGIRTGITKKIMISGIHSSATFTLPFKPVFTALNLNEAIQAEAIAPDTAIITKTGLSNFTNSQLKALKITSLSDSLFLYIEHNYVAPDSLKDTALHYRLSPNHYWKISGIYPTSFAATAEFIFDGNPGSLDTILTKNTTDSLLLLYRKSAAEDWKEFPAYTKTILGPPTSKYGYFQIDSVPQGEYTFANGVSHVTGIKETKPVTQKMSVYPNPASSDFTVGLTTPVDNECLCIYNIQGQLVGKVLVEHAQNSYTLNSAKWASGTYSVTLLNNNKAVATQQVIITH